MKRIIEFQFALLLFFCCHMSGECLDLRNRDVFDNVVDAYSNRYPFYENIQENIVVIRFWTVGCGFTALTDQSIISLSKKYSAHVVFIDVLSNWREDLNKARIYRKKRLIKYRYIGS